MTRLSIGMLTTAAVVLAAPAALTAAQACGLNEVQAAKTMQLAQAVPSPNSAKVPAATPTYPPGKRQPAEDPVTNGAGGGTSGSGTSGAATGTSGSGSAGASGGSAGAGAGSGAGGSGSGSGSGQ